DLELLKGIPNIPRSFLANPEDALARLLIERDRLDEAEPLVLSALDHVRADLSNDDWRVGFAEVLIGRYLLARERFAEAELRLNDGYQLLHKAGKDSRDEGRYAISTLISLYDAWHRPDRAERWRTALRQSLPATMR